MTHNPHNQDEVTKSKEAKSEEIEAANPRKKAKKPTLTKKQLEKALDEAQAEVEKHKTQLAYVQADHENYVKSMEKHKTQLRLQANRDLILSLLPILDDLERAQIMVPQIEMNAPFIEGLSMLVDNLKTTLQNAGVKAISCEGQAFDPLRHEAVVRKETSEVPPNTVIEELRKGYLLKGALLRPSTVKIAIAPKSPEAAKTSPVKGEKPKKNSSKKMIVTD
ncbi:MAG: nucleotide exchange factor GrpE [Candidatus Hermodarchaeota archaeon]|jgi:molecular chaperone GrpE|nr:nucleotide exchange factor GrpE [Candidatus Hermodarchaeota archaeon]